MNWNRMMWTRLVVGVTMWVTIATYLWKATEGL